MLCSDSVAGGAMTVGRMCISVVHVESPARVPRDGLPCSV